MIFIKLREAMESYRRRTGEKLTYEELSRRTGLSRATIEAIGSRGEYNPTLSTIDVICATLQCSLEELLERVDREKSEDQFSKGSSGQMQPQG